MTTDDLIVRHYAQSDLTRAILDALAKAGKNIDALDANDLAPLDEFHIGGRQATAALAEQLGLAPGLHVLDIGCGIGGAARYFATTFGCRVTGVDLTEEYVEGAAALSRRCGLAARTLFRAASATALPFADATFDAATMLHVGMNVADKAALFAEVRRVLKAGGMFGLYDVMRESDGELIFPLPWSSSADASFVGTAATYRALLENSGFRIEKERNRRDFALEFFRRVQARIAESGVPKLGLQFVMGRDTAQKAANLSKLIADGVVAPVEMVTRAV
jgi:ubiquinone/menaquinone biosynthesis C-methylase UbiE